LPRPAKDSYEWGFNHPINNAEWLKEWYKPLMETKTFMNAEYIILKLCPLMSTISRHVHLVTRLFSRYIASKRVSISTINSLTGNVPLI
jgi:hypothetical protein